jgi:hypothetical protein
MIIETTQGFIQLAKKELSELKSNPDSNPQDIERWESWAAGKCASCNADLQLEEKLIMGEQTAYKFHCGHKHILMTIKLDCDVQVSFKAASIAETIDGKQRIQARVSGIKQPKEAEEWQAVALFADHVRPELVDFYSPEQNSHIDIVAQNKEKTYKEYFQVTKLQSTEFWRELAKHSATDLVTDEIVKLVKIAIERKQKHFGPKERASVILLIEAWPGILEKYALEAKSKLTDILERAVFKEVWLVGHDKEQTYKLWP